MTQRLAFFACRPYSFDARAFVEEARRFSPRSLVVFYDFRQFALGHAPEDFDKGLLPMPYRRTASAFLNKMLLPLLFLIDMAALARFLWKILRRYRPEICWIEHTYAAVFLCLFKRLGLCPTLVYLPGDWLGGHKTGKLLSDIANNVIYPRADGFVMKRADLVLFGNPMFRTKRLEYWKRNVPRKDGVYSPLRFPAFSAAQAANGDRHSLCFIGDARPDAGLDLVLRALETLSRQGPFRVKMIGPRGEGWPAFSRMIAASGVADRVDILGYLPEEELAEAVQDCFCGLNVLTSDASYSSCVIPGKQLNYLRFLLPIIATRGAGTLVPDIETAKLGRIIPADATRLEEAVLDIHRHQAAYRKNMLDYIRRLQPLSIEELLRHGAISR
ncbi:MAG: glycosyltransferase [Deltaproteobacteria bacterium]